MIAGAADTPPRHWAGHLYLQVLLAIALGAALSALSPATGEALKPLGDAFIKLVRMTIAPVIFLTLATGIAGAAELKGLGRVAARALTYFLAVSTLALVVGLVVGNLVRPGAGFGADPATLDAGAVRGYVAQAHEAGAPASCRCCSSRSCSASRSASPASRRGRSSSCSSGWRWSCSASSRS